MAVRVPKELTERDPAVVAPAAGLLHIPDTEPGSTRMPNGDGFDYFDAAGSAIDDATEIERIDALAIPPAWTSVWICSEPDGYLNASGVDEAGRKQYRYHDMFRAFGDARKFERLSYFPRAIVLLRKAAADALTEAPGTRNHAVAAAVMLIDRCLLRVGNDRSAENGHYGATTLTVDHVVDAVAGDSGHVTLEYIAKSGKARTIVIEDDDLSDVLTELADDADDELFWFDDPDADTGRRRATADDINRFVVDVAGPAFSAKDFRTWGGSRTALAARIDGDDVLRAIDSAADDLGNTRAVARSSYVHPRVTECDLDELDEIWRSSRSTAWMDRAERSLTKLLTERRATGGGSTE